MAPLEKEHAMVVSLDYSLEAQLYLYVPYYGGRSTRSAWSCPISTIW